MNDELISRSALLELYENTPELNLDIFNVPVPVVRQNIIDMPAVKAVKLNDLLDYVDKAFDRSPYESRWITDTGEQVGCDVGYAWEWWRDCMEPELIRVFGKKEMDSIKHGKWSEVAYVRVTHLTEVSPGVWVSGTQFSETRYQCSVCKEYKNVFEKYDFCPNCGARMDLEENHV